MDGTAKDNFSYNRLQTSQAGKTLIFLNWSTYISGIAPSALYKFFVSGDCQIAQQKILINNPIAII